MIARDFIIRTRDLDRLEQCPAAGVFSLPRGQKPETSPSMWWGIFVHRFLEYAIERGRDYALDYIKRKFNRAYKTCSRIDIDYLRGLPGIETEISWAHDPIKESARRLPLWPDTFKTFDRARETFCKADLVMWDDLPHVADFKCGTHKISPVGHCQLEGMALALARETDMDQVKASIIAVPSSGHLIWRTITLDREALEIVADRERTVFLNVLDARKRWAHGERPAFVAGPACEKCELKPRCPAHGAELVIEKEDAL